MTNEEGKNREVIDKKKHEKPWRQLIRMTNEKTNQGGDEGGEKGPRAGWD